LIAAVVLAAGTSSRMGRPKQNLPLSGVPILEMTLRTFRRSKVGKVVVILGAHAEEVKKDVKFAGEEVVFNPRFSDGMSSSLRFGLDRLGTEVEAAIVALGDQPFVRSTTIDGIVAAYGKTGAKIVVPTYRGTRGNPVLFDRSVFPLIGRIRGDVGARSVVEQNAADVLELEVPDEGILVDIDTPSDLEGETEVRSRRNLGRASRPPGHRPRAS
jgi:molybdenum cofactor cytidylyltransferase